MYKESKYNIKYIDENGDIVLYNSRTNAVTIVKENNTEKLESILKIPNKYSDNEAIKKRLIKYEFLIKKEYDELQEIKHRYESAISTENGLQLTLVPTGECNFRCKYCFVDEYKNENMSETTYNDIFKFIENKIVESKDKLNFFLGIQWYGMESLLVKDEIINFSKKINELKNREGIKVRYSFLTNGYLLTKEIMIELLNVEINNFQITVDGTKENHDYYRPLKNGGKTFDVIYNNIKKISSEIEKKNRFFVKIRANYSMENIENMKEFYNKIRNEFRNDNRINIYFSPIIGFKTNRSSNDEISGDICAPEKRGLLKININKETVNREIENLSKKELHKMLPKRKEIFCSALLNNYYVIGYDRSVFGCQSCIGKKEKSVGKLINGQIEANSKRSEWLLSIFEDEACLECMECKTLPLCMGGCKFERINNEKIVCFMNETDIKMNLKLYLEEYRKIETRGDNNA